MVPDRVLTDRPIWHARIATGEHKWSMLRQHGTAAVSRATVHSSARKTWFN